MKRYELIEHTADVAIKAYGKTVAKAFENAAIGMFDIITDNSTIDDIGQYDIQIEATDKEQLLVDWLSELLFLSSAKNLVFGNFNVTIKDEHLTARVFGEEFDSSKHRIGTEIKAVTYHMLEVHNRQPYYVQVLFDI
ncbi:MAG: archease [Petrotogales bacterium]